MKKQALAFAVAALSMQASVGHALEVGVILDVYHKSDDTALNGRTEGFGLSHSELSLSQDIGDVAKAQMTWIAEWNEEESDLELEELYIQSTSLPGISLTAGRFLADIGYLNANHSHSDSFSERPLMYKAFLGGHYYDDGVSASWIVPTDRYWRVSAAAFGGDELGEEKSVNTIGTWTLSTEFGDDFGNNSSWQAGISYMRNRTQEAGHHEEEEDHDHEEEHDHDHEGHAHSHGAEYQGEHLYIADLVWKWSPNGNNRQEQLKIAAEYAYVDDLYGAEVNDFSGWYLSGVYQFDENWAAGIRHGQVDLAHEHEHDGEHEWEDSELKETAVMVSWSPTHTQKVRLEYRHQDADNMEGEDNAITLQYQVGFGAHAAHSF
ncbi:hypothetical protein ACMXYN_14785 [Neptuniibacter sp. PT8_73]|uniref:hypothetical protein n=1 Tax=Neptuniibacter sp. PT8_73 TaxID=3398206 RepID=UPI0039F5BDAC